MAGWNRVRAAVVGGAAVAAAWAVVALAAPAQNPIPQPMPPGELKFFLESPGAAAKKDEEKLLPPVRRFHLE